MAENRNNKRPGGSRGTGGAKKSSGSFGSRTSSYGNKTGKSFSPRKDKPYSEGSESGEGKKPSKKEKSFSRNKAMRREKSAESFKDYPKSKGSGFKPKAFNRDRSETSEKTPYARNDKYAEKKFGKTNERKPRFNDDKPKSFGKKDEQREYTEKKFGKTSERKPRYNDDKPKSFGKTDEKGEYTEKKFGKTDERKSRFNDDKPRSFAKKDEQREKTGFKAEYKKDGFKKKDDFKSKKRFDNDEDNSSKRYKHDEFEERSSYKKSERYSDFKDKKGKTSRSKAPKKNDDGLVRLNKFLANAGVASRRDADVLIQSGAVQVNGVVVTEMGYKIKPTDEVHYGGESVKGERKVYLLLNKPKDCITTTDDPQERKTVMNLVKTACKERIYPVGRLDRNTTGLLLMTNDGEIAARLTHPKYNIKKVYQVTLTKGLKAEDLQQIQDGIELEDGFIKADEIAYLGEGKKEIGVEIHSGRNRIIRRIFEHLGYDIIKLDRVSFAGLTKKDLPRGKYRFLEPKEVAFLRMIGG